MLVIELDEGGEVRIPRRELWDVRGQVAVSDSLDGDGDGNGNDRKGEGGGEGKMGGEVVGVGLGLGLGLGKEDVKTGVYEGGFKSWESSCDLVKELGGKVGSCRGYGLRHGESLRDARRGKQKRGGKVVELGCGTALPALAVLGWFLQPPSREHGEDGGNGKEEEAEAEAEEEEGLKLILADYNHFVLSLVTFPNVLLMWYYRTHLAKDEEEWDDEGEVEITEPLITDFLADLRRRKIELGFLSGGWGREFVELVLDELGEDEEKAKEKEEEELLILGAETIYSPAALSSFADTVMGILAAGRKDGQRGEKEGERTALVAAKKVYFCVGGSMEDFCGRIGELGGGEWGTRRVREERIGVWREAVEVGRVGGEGGLGGLGG